MSLAAQPEVFERELRGAGFSEIEITTEAHAMRSPDADALWHSLQESFAPVAWLKREEPERFAAAAGGALRRLRDICGPGLVELPAPAHIAYAVA